MQKTLENYLEKYQAGQGGDLHEGARRSRVSDRRPGSTGESGQRPLSVAAAADPRGRARRRSQWRRRRTVAVLLAPWAIGFGAFFAYPLLASLYYSFTHYDLLSSPRWIGLRNYEYLFNTDPQIWTAVKNTLWLIAIMVPAQVLFALGLALLLSRARRGVGVLRTIFYLPALAPIVAATLGFVYPVQPRDRAGEHDPERDRHRRAAVAERDEHGEADARAAGAVEHRRDADHLPRGGARRAHLTCSSRQSSTARARGGGFAT